MRMIEHALFHCEHVRCTWFCSPLGLIFYDIPVGTAGSGGIGTSKLLQVKDNEIKAMVIVLWWSML